MPSSSEIVKGLFDKFVVSNYGRAPISFVRGRGSELWDAEGNRYLDLLPGLGVNGLGHCPKQVTRAVGEQLNNLMHVHNNYIWESQGRLAEALAGKLTGMKAPRTFFCNSGSEASESAIKTARLWGKAHGGKNKIIAVSGSFHGRTYAAISATGQPALQAGIEPLLSGFSHVPLNDLQALQQAFDDQTVAFMVEPVQGEGGVHPCTREYLEGARALCDQKGALLLYDEVQCGMGRTGDYFAYQTLGAPAPDIIWSAKALGGGFPIGAMMANSSVAEAMAPGTHGSTYGGNPLACVAALAVIETIDKEDLLAYVQVVGQHLGAGLEKLRERFPDKVKEVRRVGLMVGFDLKIPVADVVVACRDAGLLVNGTQGTVLRFLPALNVTRGQLDEGLEILGKVLEVSK